MASSPNLAAALFLLILALFSSAAHGRESHFFSKVSANTNPTTTNTTTVTISPEANATAGNTSAVDPDSAVNNRQQNQQQEPSFVQEAENNVGYGIYGHQTLEETAPFDQTATTTKLTSSPTNNYIPYNTQTNSDDTFRNQNSNNNEKYYNNDRYYGESGYNADSRDEFEDDQPQEFGEPSLQQQDSNGYETAANSAPEFGNRLSGGFAKPVANTNSNGYETAANSAPEFGNRLSGGFANTNSNGGERQGMSDTRYLEGGKYYVHVNNPNQYQQGMSSSSSSSNDHNYNYNYNSNSVNRNGYNNINGDDQYVNPMNNWDQQQPEYYEGNNYQQNQQYVP